MNDELRLELAEKMFKLTDEQRLEFLNELPIMPSAEDLASIQNLIDNLKGEATEAVCKTPVEDATPVIA